MKVLYADTLLTVSADISRGSRDMTWSELQRIMGADAPETDKVRNALTHGETYDMDGLLIYRKDTPPTV